MAARFSRDKKKTFFFLVYSFGLKHKLQLTVGHQLLVSNHQIAKLCKKNDFFMIFLNLQHISAEQDYERELQERDSVNQ